MPDCLHVHIPYRQLDELLPMAIERSLQPEIGFKGPDLDQLDPELVDRAAASLAEAGLAVTVHAPFFDLNPGALEPYVSEATTIRFRQAMAASSRLGARLVVFHPGYEYWKYGGMDHLWLEASQQFWPPLIELAEDYEIVMALENIFETRPDTLRDLLDSIDSPWLGHCFDIGHWRLFAEASLPEWFRALGHRIVHLHLHDNTGKGDDHRPIGEGDIDFAELFRLTGSLPSAPTMTLEAHTVEELERSLASIQRYFHSNI
ncbi:MAG: sugar phosphate isomerase/epimerase, partial [Desulfuromonadales bacterium]|nr:sugar phosphate isomerase/epimerase [Desulfuromonadales bacterium]